MPAIRGDRSTKKTRRRARDVDQVYADLRDSKHLSQHRDTKAAEDLPALGQHYCVECAKWFEGDRSLLQHRRGKPHKRRLRQLKEEPYTQKEAEAAAGLYTDNGTLNEKMAIDAEGATATGRQEDQRVGDDNDDEVYDAFFSTYQEE
ncbi:MAG: Bud site selection protein 20 [Alyxoria varia]|nr:MAG: Bud site selection protein 20 [Alyxoria varia]